MFYGLFRKLGLLEFRTPRLTRVAEVQFEIISGIEAPFPQFLSLMGTFKEVLHD